MTAPISTRPTANELIGGGRRRKRQCHRRPCRRLGSLMPWLSKVKVVRTYLAGQAGARLLRTFLWACKPQASWLRPMPTVLTTFPALRTSPAHCTVEQESIYVGYRYFDYRQKDVLFPSVSVCHTELVFQHKTLRQKIKDTTH